MRAVPADTREDISRWDREGLRLKEQLPTTQPTLDDADFHFLMHYLDDAGSRANDPAYTAHQEALLRVLIDKLEAGPSVGDGGLTPEE